MNLSNPNAGRKSQSQEDRANTALAAAAAAEKSAAGIRLQPGRTGKPNPPADTGAAKPQEFIYAAPAAQSVQLAGDFTGWQQQPVSLRKGPNGIWRSVIWLKPGLHAYRFIVDGQWHDDPECTRSAPNPFGSVNAVRQVN